MDGQQPSSEWSPSIPRIVHHPKFTRIKYDKDLGIQTSLARLRPFDKIKTRLQLRLQLRLRDNGQGSKDKGKEIRPKIMKLKLMLTLNTKFVCPAFDFFDFVTVTSPPMQKSFFSVKVFGSKYLTEYLMSVC